MLPVVSGEFNLGKDPELRYTPGGKAVCEVLLIASKRKKDEATNEWTDDKVLFLRGSVWDQVAENVAESLSKGDKVEVRGAIFTDEYEDKDGVKKSTTKMQIYSIAASVANATLKVTRAQRSQPSEQPSGGGQWGNDTRSQPADDPWSTAPSGGGQPDEAPF